MSERKIGEAGNSELDIKKGEQRSAAAKRSIGERKRRGGRRRKRTKEIEAQHE